MNKKDNAKHIVDYLGGEGNIGSIAHCATRLRFDIRDRSKIQEDKLKELNGILGIADKGGQYQIIIGPEVEKLFKEIVPLLENVQINTIDAESADEDSSKKEESLFNRILSYISGSIQPTLPVLIGAGMVNAFLAVAVAFGLSNESGTYVTLSSLANVGFVFLPVIIAFSAARKMKTNEYIAAFLILAMIVAFDQQEGMTLFSMNIPVVKYSNSIIPALLMVPVQYLVEKYINKYIPAAIHFTIKPLITVLILAPVILFILGPIGSLIGGALAQMSLWLMNTIGSLAMAFLAAIHPITVMFGVHYLFTPIMANEVAQTGATFVLSRALAANFSMAGAAIAVGYKAKKKSNKNMGYTSGVTALISVTEPALFGVLIRLKRPLIASIGAAAVSGLFLGIFQVHAYAIASPNLFSLPIYIGGESMTNFFLAILGALIAFVLGFVFTILLGFKEE